MAKIQNKDTRYFLVIDRKTLKISRYGYDQKERLNKGRQTDPESHRLFLTKGQYSKFVERCASNLASIDKA